MVVEVSGGGKTHPVMKTFIKVKSTHKRIIEGLAFLDVERKLHIKTPPRRRLYHTNE